MVTILRLESEYKFYITLQGIVTVGIHNHEKENSPVISLHEYQKESYFGIETLMNYS